MECPDCKKYECIRLVLYPQPANSGVMSAIVCYNCGWDRSLGFGKASWTAHAGCLVGWPSWAKVLQINLSEPIASPELQINP